MIKIKIKKKIKNKMKKIILLYIISIFFSVNLYAVEHKKCSELEGFKKLGKGTAEFHACLKNKAKKKFKLNTDSKLTDLMTGKAKFKLPNPLTGLKNVANALKPSKKASEK